MSAACISNLLRNNRPQLMQRNRSGKLALSNVLDRMKSVTMGHPLSIMPWSSASTAKTGVSGRKTFYPRSGRGERSKSESSARVSWAGKHSLPG